jgi:hypothetical protein
MSTLSEGNVTASRMLTVAVLLLLEISKMDPKDWVFLAELLRKQECSTSWCVDAFGDPIAVAKLLWRAIETDDFRDFFDDFLVVFAAACKDPNVCRLLIKTPAHVEMIAKVLYSNQKNCMPVPSWSKAFCFMINNSSSDVAPATVRAATIALSLAMRFNPNANSQVKAFRRLAATIHHALRLNPELVAENMKAIAFCIVHMRDRIITCGWSSDLEKRRNQKDAFCALRELVRACLNCDPDWIRNTNDTLLAAEFKTKVESKKSKLSAPVIKWLSMYRAKYHATYFIGYNDGKRWKVGPKVTTLPLSQVSVWDLD